MNINKMMIFILDKLPEKPKSAIILGSGLGEFCLMLRGIIRIPYTDVPFYPTSSIEGHAGEWVFGYINKKPVICASGRFHHYEGFTLEQIALPVLVTYALGCRTLFITNASGCVNLKWQLGDLMLIQGYLDYSFLESTDIPPIVLLKKNDFLYNKLENSALDINIKLRKGIYTWTLGPSYETPAEIQDIILKGGNAVGMSTVPELKKAQELGMDVIGISCLTNYGAGLMNEPLTHKAILDSTRKMKRKFITLMKKII